MKRQHAEWPHTQLTTSTHDTKRAEDVRARLNVLTEVPELWQQAVRRWSAVNERHRENNQPDRNAEYLIYQTLVGAWPLPEDRLQAYMEKASHEAKQHTDWTKPNPQYEQALKKFIAEALHDSEFTADLEKFCGHIADAAMVNSLAQTLIKLTAPGVPDIYQGCELWDLSLVDPDNRRPVDFALRKDLAEALGAFTAEKAWERRADGFAKMWLIQKALMCRADLSDFSSLGYEAVTARGARKDHVVAFSRGGKVIVVAPRFWLKLNGDWQDTTLDLPAGRWQNELTGDVFENEIHMAGLHQKFPVALLVPKEND
jgi:(1->4)-alpha-D-glucan 1-alpha-D-glucosylmutase